MNAGFRDAITAFSFIVMAPLAGWPLPAPAHTIECSGRAGIELARCERHQKMAAKCGPLKGEAHFACDREFLLANPLDCTVLAGEDAGRCFAERQASKTCESRPGIEFMRCVRSAIQASPMGAR